MPFATLFREFLWSAKFLRWAFVESCIGSLDALPAVEVLRSVVRHKWSAATN